jgi:hypothetical protein
MFGEIAIMVNHLAKLYDISLKYPLFINGSRSYILFGKEEYLYNYFQVYSFIFYPKIWRKKHEIRFCG